MRRAQGAAVRGTLVDGRGVGDVDAWGGGGIGLGERDVWLQL